MINVLNTTRLTVGGTMYRVLFEGKDIIFTVDGKKRLNDVSIIAGTEMYDAPIELKSDLYQAFKEHEARVEARLGTYISSIPTLAELEASADLGQDIDGDFYRKADGSLGYYTFTEVLDKAIKEGLIAYCPTREEE